MAETCSRCGSDKMMEDVRLTPSGAGGYMRLLAYIHSNPNGWLLKGTVIGTLRARVCGACGYTEIHTKNFEKLYEAYQQSHGG